MFPILKEHWNKSFCKALKLVKVNNYSLVNISFSVWIGVADYFIIKQSCVIIIVSVSKWSFLWGIYSVYKAIFKTSFNIDEFATGK